MNEMNENEIREIQETIIKNLRKLDDEKKDIPTEISRCNSIAQLANTYIKSCNLTLKVNEIKQNLKGIVKKTNVNEK